MSGTPMAGKLTSRTQYNNSDPDQKKGISARSTKLLKGPLSYIDVFINAMSDLWSPTNTDGWVPLVVAENKLGNDIVLNRLEKVKNYPTWVMNYGGMLGAPALQSALAGVMNRTFIPYPTLEPDKLLLLAGCSAILTHFFYCIAEEDHSVLIPAPYYPAFDNDLQATNNVVPVPCTLPFFAQDNGSSLADALTALARERYEGHSPVKALLITNPNNPLGIIYSDEDVKTMIQWCLSNQIHYVSDEIYALSVYKKGNIRAGVEDHLGFRSALTIAEDMIQAGEISREDADLYLHVLYGLSKDWCASGLRVGALYTNNKLLKQALGSLAPFSGISNHTQHALAEALNDEAWTSEFIEKNSSLLELSYDALADGLQAANIPFTPAVAGMFVWVDLRQWLPDQSWEGEAALWKRVCDEAKVILTPGEACHSPEPGYFRLCFAWVPTEALRDAIKRLERVLLQ